MDNNALDQTGIKGEIIKTVKGRDLIDLEYMHPFIERTGVVYPSEFVTLTSGTGLVHMAPGHGIEDYIVGQRYGLEPFSPVDDRGTFTEEAPPFLQGMNIFEANSLIIEKLREKNLLLFEEKITHSYPHCWRCKNPVIFRATPQWFIRMESSIDGETLSISRQRYWGVPITVFYCEDCGAVISEEKIFEHISDIVENHPEGADIWFKAEPEELLPKGYTCPKCGGSKFRKEEDILDVWFDSGCSHAGVIRPLGVKKADLYLEGSDQHRGWFQASLLESVGSYGEAPYKAVLTHGFVVDEAGKKMSKSEGNVISPQEIINRYGADILRLWVVSEDYTEDIKIGQNIIRMIVEDYRKIRNTMRFMLSNLYDFDPSSNSVPYEEMFHFDKWILSRLGRIVNDVMNSYENYKFHQVYHTIRNFASKDLSSIYLEKDYEVLLKLRDKASLRSKSIHRR